MNAVLVKGDAVGATMYYGAGAGAEPTASAVVADLVDVTRLHTADPEHRVPHLAFQPESLESALSATPILPIGEVRTAYYLRLRVADKPGVLADITRILADAGISIGAFLQKEPAEGTHATDIIMLTHGTIEKRVDAAIARIEHARHGAVAGHADPRRGPGLTMRLNQVTVATHDVERSIAFYRTLGLELVVHASHYARFVCPDGRSTFSVHRTADRVALDDDRLLRMRRPRRQGRRAGGRGSALRQRADRRAVALARGAAARSRRQPDLPLLRRHEPHRPAVARRRDVAPRVTRDPHMDDR